MHGIIYQELKKYVVTNLGDDAWDKLMEKSGLGFKSYLATGQYPDSEIVALVNTASKMTMKPAEEILKDFGRFIVPDLAKVYSGLIRPEWTALDLIENVEEVIHKVIRRQDPNATPPKLDCRRPAKNEVRIIYTSPRKMCHVAKGIIAGLGDLYGEHLKVSESSCMHQGDLDCEIVVRSAY